MSTPQRATGEYPLHRAVRVGELTRIIRYVLKRYPAAARLPTNDGWYPLQLYLSLPRRRRSSLVLKLADAAPHVLSLSAPDGSIPFLKAAEALPLRVVYRLLRTSPEAIEEAIRVASAR